MQLLRTIECKTKYVVNDDPEETFSMLPDGESVVNPVIGEKIRQSSGSYSNSPPDTKLAPRQRKRAVGRVQHLGEQQPNTQRTQTVIARGR